MATIGHGLLLRMAFPVMLIAQAYIIIPIIVIHHTLLRVGMLSPSAVWYTS